MNISRAMMIDVYYMFWEFKLMSLYIYEFVFLPNIHGMFV